MKLAAPPCLPASHRHYSRLITDAVFELKNYIDGNALTRKPVPDLLLQTSVGQNMIRNAFRDMVGCTIVHYQMRKRFEQAALLLAEEMHTIQQVAVLCGYRGNIPGFSTDFKKVYGLSPREWLRVESLKKHNIS